MNHLPYFLCKHARLVAVLSLFITLPTAFYTVQLYKNLRTDIEELLPTTSRSVKDLEEVTHRLESIDNVVLLAFSQDTIASKKFIIKLAKELSKVSKDLISSVEYKIDKEVQFFKERRSLFIETEDLIKLRNYISLRLEYEGTLYNPLNIFSGINIPEPKFDFPTLKQKYGQKIAGYDHFPEGFYATHDQKVRAIVIYMPGKGLDKAQKMKNAVHEVVRSLDPKSFAPDLEVKYTGNLQNLLEESAALVADLEVSTVICVILVTGAMLLFFRSPWATAALVASLFMGTFWTFGASYFLVGYLNANTAFLASIVIGNGINFGIIFLARYLEERRNGMLNDEAIKKAMSGTMAATLTAALAAGLSYGSLMLTGFRGFSQFGVIGLVGMILCWISAFALLPSFLTLLDRHQLIHWSNEKGRFDTLFLVPLSNFVEKFPGVIWIASNIAVVLSLALLPNYKYGIIETDLAKLRDKGSVKEGSGALYHYIDDIFRHSFSPMVVLPHRREDGRKIAELLKKERERQGPNSAITLIQTLDDFVPQDQVRKVKILGQIRDLLPPRIMSRLPDAEKNLAQELLRPEGMQIFTEKDLPELVLSKFREKNGMIGNMVLVDKSFSKDGSDDANALVSFVKTGRGITDSVGSNIPVAGGLPVSYDMYQAIVSDGPKATLFAFMAVVILVIIMFRNIKTITLVLFALTMGGIWLAGIILAFHFKINFLNFIALPITFGIGVDYGVNIFSRYREEGPGKILSVIRDTGGAVILSSFTTCVGYSSLLIAGNQAFVSFGWLAVLGEIACVTAAVISLPAFLCYLDKRKPVYNETELTNA
jgi:uncharacterized membrane protein YdfJ with MMPL/SSD domain